jgi:hypothetical protein
MKKIQMTKYGFVRWPEEDFSDDGSRFMAYRVGERVRVTKCTFNGEAYIDGTIHGTKLPYEVYSKLPHYDAIGKLNGISIENLIDQDLIDLYNDCLAYEQEYIEAERTIQMPTLDEIKARCLEIQVKRTAELFDVKQLLADKAVELAVSLSEWRWKDVRHYLVCLSNQLASFNPEAYAPTILNSSRSIGFCKPDCSELKDSWYYTNLLELFNSVQV